MYGVWGLFSSFLLLSDFQGSQVVAGHSEAWPALAAACAATTTKGAHRSVSAGIAGRWMGELFLLYHQKHTSSS